MLYEPTLAFVPLFLVGLGLLAAGILLLGLLDQKKPKPGPTQVTARGGYLPIVIGRHRVGGSILWRGDRIKRGVDADQLNDYDEGTQGGEGFSGGARVGPFGDDKEQIDTFLERGMVALNIGCAHSINQIYVDGKTILNAPIAKTTTGSGRSVQYNAPGSISSLAKLRPYFGNSNDYDRSQTTYKLVAQRMGFINLDENRNVPTWPNLVFVIFDYFYMGPQARWGRIEADVTVLPIAQEDLPPEFSFAAASPDLFDGGGGVNPAYAIWVLLTGKYPYGVGMPKEKIDKTSLNTIGVALASEGLFININTADGEKAADLVQEIFDDCGIVTSEVNGLLHFTLIRQGDAALTLDEDGLSPPIEQIEVNAEPFRPRSVEFQYLSNKVGFDQDTINVEQDGFSQYRGSKKRDKVDLKVITQDTIANRVAYRRAQEIFSLQYSVTFTTARDGRLLRPGLLVNLPAFGGLRISKVEYDFNSPKVKVTAYTDPFLVPVLEYENDPGGEKPGEPFKCPDGSVPVVDPTKPFASIADFCPDIVEPDTGGPPSPCANDDCTNPETKEEPVACCFGLTGICEDLTPTQCLKAKIDGVNGVPQGPGTNCGQGFCPTPQIGSCCQSDGGCSNTTFQDCQSIGGNFDPDNLCFDETTEPNGIECEAPVVGICCGKGLQPECLESRSGVCPDGYTFVNTRTTCPEDDDEYCCTVHEDFGACCYCVGDKTQCFESDQVTCLENSGVETPIFTPGKSCCELEAEGGCTNNCEKDKPVQIEPDRYVRPLVLPVHFDIRNGAPNSNVVVLRSAYDKELATNELYYRKGGIGSGTLAPRNMSNPSVPGGDNIDAIVIPPTQPRHQILYHTDVNGTIFDNGHAQDLVNIEVINNETGRRGWFSGDQPILHRDSQQVLFARSAVGFGESNGFAGTFRSVLLGRTNSIFPKGCFFNKDVGSVLQGDLLAYHIGNVDNTAVTGGILDRLDAVSNNNAFLIPLGGTREQSANYTAEFAGSTLEFESVPCNDADNCGSQENLFVPVDTLTDGVVEDGRYTNFVTTKLVDIPYVRAGSAVSSPYLSSARLRQDTSITGHKPTSAALTTPDTRLGLMPGIWKIAKSGGKTGFPAGNNPVINYDNTLIEKYWTDLIVEIGLPRFGQTQPVPDEKGYGIQEGNFADTRTYGSGQNGDPLEVQYAVTLYHGYFPLFIGNDQGGFEFSRPNGQLFKMLPLVTKKGTVGQRASGSIFETITPTEIRTAFNDKFGTNTSALNKFFNVTRSSAESVAISNAGLPTPPICSYISICLEDQNGRRATAFIGPTDTLNGSVLGHADPCQNLSTTTSGQFTGTKNLQFITPSDGVGSVPVSHWDSTLTAVYGRGYKLQ